MVAYHLMPVPEVERVVGFGKSKIYELLNPAHEKHDPSFPKPIVLSPRCVRWRSDEVQAWMDARSADRDIGHAARKEQARNAGKASAAKRKASPLDLAGQA